jgi:drug/metabolite transporter (DMT)-like permease
MERLRRGYVYGLVAAISFGISAPIAKRLLDDVSPQLLAGLLYLGAFLALGALLPSRRHGPEAHLRRADVPRIAGLIATGGVVAPVLLLAGLERVSGATGSLLLNLEGPFTLLLAVVVFREHLGRHPAVGAAAIFVGAAILSWAGPTSSRDVMGAACIAAACALWAIDNNLTQTLTVRDPFVVVTVKAGASAAVNITIAITLGSARPPPGTLLTVLALGAVSYGASVVLDAYALRALGAAREAAVFATAPFVGALVAVTLFGETLNAREIAAGVLMAIGVALILTERHEHIHVHEPTLHEHVHVHDEHHQHDHDPGVETSEPHAHLHEHHQLEHSHRHVSDVHHRHDH